MSGRPEASPLPLPRPHTSAKPSGHSWNRPASLAPAWHPGASARVASSAPAPFSLAPMPTVPSQRAAGDLNVGPNLADPTRASFSRTARRRSFTVIHWVSVSPCGTGCLRVLWEPCPLSSQSSDADPPAEQLLAEHLLHASMAARNVFAHCRRAWVARPPRWGPGP